MTGLPGTHLPSLDRGRSTSGSSCPLLLAGPSPCHGPAAGQCKAPPAHSWHQGLQWHLAPLLTQTWLLPAHLISVQGKKIDNAEFWIHEILYWNKCRTHLLIITDEYDRTDLLVRLCFASKFHFRINHKCIKILTYKGIPLGKTVELVLRKECIKYIYTFSFDT